MGRVKSVCVVTPAVVERINTTLESCLRSVISQDWEGDITHCLVFEGPRDEQFVAMMRNYLAPLAGYSRTINFSVLQTGRRWHKATGGRSWGMESLAVGLYLCDTTHAVILADDDTIAPNHISSLVEMLELHDESQDASAHHYAMCSYLFPDGRVIGDGRVIEHQAGDGMIMFAVDEYSLNPHRVGGYTHDFEWLSRFTADKVGSFTHQATYHVRPHAKRWVETPLGAELVTAT